jgi:hypothetical protein
MLDEIEFFERKRTDRQIVELAILLYNFGVSFRKVARVSAGSTSSGQTLRCGTMCRSSGDA